ncbi:MAG: acyl-CoA dehydrogenase family protein, partial [Dehalococcoidales bacterium]|nr:acyl-CoA dehydrogenase family protein [Dehalococcoidales bacterium]
MEFRFSEEQEKFRQEVRDFLEAEIKKGVFKPSNDAWVLQEDTELGQDVAKKGWIGLTWPREYGGGGRGYLDRLVMHEEFMRYGASMAFLMGDRQMGPAIIDYGTEEQKKYFLPRIVRNELRFAAGMSEPEAGSDLANIKTKAVEDGDSFVINGQKLWTSRAHLCDYIYMLVRTTADPALPKYRGLSDLIVDLKTPGITVKPVIDMTGGHKWNEVFFDNVRVPKTTLIGKKDSGWFQHMSHLDHERSGIERLMANYFMLVKITEYCKNTKRNGTTLWEEGWVRHLLTDLFIKLEVGKMLIYRVAWLIDHHEILATDKLALTKATSLA